MIVVSLKRGEIIRPGSVKETFRKLVLKTNEGKVAQKLDAPHLGTPRDELFTQVYRGTSFIRNSAPLGPYSRTLHRDPRWP